VLKLTSAARPLLKSEIRLELAKPRIKESRKKTKRPQTDIHGPYDEQLFDELRRLRKQLADAEGKPPYIVFGDATLVQMARDKPLSEEELLGINGVGERKLEKYGRDFLDAIAGYFVENRALGDDRT
jgi:ATP-dependent DNA helicase RecQ